MATRIIDSLIKPKQRQQSPATNHLAEQSNPPNHTIEPPNLVKFSMDDLTMIAGGHGPGKPDDENESDGITLNHNETFVALEENKTMLLVSAMQ